MRFLKDEVRDITLVVQVSTFRAYIKSRINTDDIYSLLQGVVATIIRVRKFLRTTYSDQDDLTLEHFLSDLLQ